MSSKTSAGISKFSWVLWTAFILLSVWGGLDSTLITQHSRQRLALQNPNAPDIAPANVARMAEDLQAALRSQLPQAPVDEITRLKAWKELDATLKECARRLELQDSQSQELSEFLGQRHLWILGGSFLCAIIWVLASLADQRKTVEELRVERRVKALVVLTGCIGGMIGFGYGAWSLLSMVNDMARDVSGQRVWGLTMRDFGLLCALPPVLLMVGIVIWTVRFLRRSRIKPQ